MVQLKNIFIKTYASSLIVGGIGLFLSGCVTREDIRVLQSDLNAIEHALGAKTEDVQTSQADLMLEMRTLSGNLEALQVELQDYREKVKALSLRLDDLEASLSARMDAQIELLSGSKFVEKPSPSTVFNLANSDYARGKNEEALKGFKNYISLFPKGELIPDAKLKMADILTKKNENSEAIDLYDQIVKQFPKNSAAPSALLRKGKLLETMNQTSKAAAVYRLLIETYPFSPETRTAQQRVTDFQNKNQR